MCTGIMLKYNHRLLIGINKIHLTFNLHDKSLHKSRGIIRFVIPVVFIINYIAVYVLSNTTILQCMYCLTQLYDGRDKYIIYNIEKN